MVADSQPPGKRDGQTENLRPKSRSEAIRKWIRKNKVQSHILVGGLLGYLLIGLILWWFLDRYISPHGSSQKKDLVQALGLIMAGLAGAIGVYFTWRNLTMTQRNMEDTQENTQKQLNLAEEGQITERFTKAIDQLGEVDDKGAPRLEIRIGGIYALERIAKHYQESSPEDYGPVMELLAAYIRENTKRIPRETSGPTLKAHQVGEILRRASAPGARGDIQAALDVLGRRDEEHMPEEYRVSLDLRRTDLSGARLTGANLSGADLTQANLSGAFLHKANLSGVDLSGADFSGATLAGANFSQALLLKTHLEGALLTGAFLSGQALAQVSRHLGKSRHEASNKMYIEGTDLTTAEELYQGQIEWAIGDSTTKTPWYLKQPEAWSNTMVPASEPPADNPPAEPSPDAPDEERKEWKARKAEWQKRTDEWEEHDQNIIEQVERIETRLKQEYEGFDEAGFRWGRRLAARFRGYTRRA